MGNPAAGKLGRADELARDVIARNGGPPLPSIFHILVGRVDLPLVLVAGHAVAFEVAQVRVHRLGADERAPGSGSALRVELHDAGLDRNPPRPRADPAVPAPGALVLQRRRCRRAPPRALNRPLPFAVPFNREGLPLAC